MVRIYMELKGRRSGLTQIGYFNENTGFISDESIHKIPFSLVDIEFAKTFSNKPEAVRAVNRAVGMLNFGFYESVRVEFKEAV